jgi:hypothetical protein
MASMHVWKVSTAKAVCQLSSRPPAQQVLQLLAAFATCFWAHTLFSHALICEHTSGFGCHLAAGHTPPARTHGCLRMPCLQLLLILCRASGPYFMQVDGKRQLLMSGTGASPEGNKPFLDLLDVDTKETTRLWQSTPPFLESVGSIMSDNNDVSSQCAGGGSTKLV